MLKYSFHAPSSGPAAAHRGRLHRAGGDAGGAGGEAPAGAGHRRPGRADGAGAELEPVDPRLWRRGAARAPAAGAHRGPQVQAGAHQEDAQEVLKSSASAAQVGAGFVIFFAHSSFGIDDVLNDA